VYSCFYFLPKVHKIHFKSFRFVKLCGVKRGLCLSNSGKTIQNRKKDTATESIENRLATVRCFAGIARETTIAADEVAMKRSETIAC
jgi:hypothetical protein